MWVRIVNTAWEDLRWSTATAAPIEENVAVKKKDGFAVRLDRGEGTDGLLANILETKRPPPRSMFRPTNKAESTQPIIPIMPERITPVIKPAPPTPPRPPRPTNPFKGKAFVSGIRPLSQPNVSRSIQPSLSAFRPFSQLTSSRPREALDFEPPKKRRIGGREVEERPKRGMRMFGSKARS
jgi:hypothetical protein